jgi:hypothetical protein
VAQSDLVAAQKRVDQAEGGNAASDGVDPDDSQSAAQSVSPSSAQSGSPASRRSAAPLSPNRTSPLKPLVVRYCERDEALPPLPGTDGRVKQFRSASDIEICDALYKSKYDLSQIDSVLIDWMGPFKDLTRDLFVRPHPGENVVMPVLAGTLLNVLSGAVLPVLYGFLGAAAAVVRNISRKFRESRLSPRDMTLSIQQLALGAVTGSCISLFVAQPVSGGQATAGLISAVALSSAALSFVAGFGVEQVFTTFEFLIKRVFPDPPPPAGVHPPAPG